ncbi:unnamed protein product, partial [Rotaria sp. Silwood2]
MAKYRDFTSIPSEEESSSEDDFTEVENGNGEEDREAEEDGEAEEEGEDSHYDDVEEEGEDNDYDVDEEKEDDDDNDEEDDQEEVITNTGRVYYKTPSRDQEMYHQQNIIRNKCGVTTSVLATIIENTNKHMASNEEYIDEREFLAFIGILYMMGTNHDN